MEPLQLVAAVVACGNAGISAVPKGKPIEWMALLPYDMLYLIG